MSMDKSLVSKNKLKRQRNVLTRAERIEKLVEEERWEESKSVFGLPKVRTIVTQRKKKSREEPAAAKAEEGEAVKAGSDDTAS